MHIANKCLHVIRDDLLPGGTKQRAAAQMLQNLAEDGFTEFVYASPFSGFAQIALASTCKLLNLKCTLFCEQNRSLLTKNQTLHEFSEIAKQSADSVYIESSLQSAEKAAKAYCELKCGSYLIPLGFQCNEFTIELAKILSVEWSHICKKLGRQPSVLWLPVGSGTLARTFRKILPQSVLLKCVNVNVLTLDDPRILDLASQSGIELYHLKQPFIEPVVDSPPIPSNRYYDAKLWKLIEKHISNDDVWWNVAR
ncbi:pyridoxal-phosphate dependent enzyme [Parashewanella spongiae]|nr:pyridoxal-phosphate dependent enzyme [Parashewanella spongiae]